MSNRDSNPPRPDPEAPARQFSQVWGGFLSGITVIDSDRVWVAEDGGRIRYSANATAVTPTWAWQATPYDVRDQLESIFFLRGGQRGFAVGDRGHVVGTTDGKTWSTLARIDDPMKPGTPAKLWDVYFLDANTGWIAAKHGILMTQDGGHTWSVVHSDIALEVYSFAFLVQGTEALGVAFAEPGTLLINLWPASSAWRVFRTIPISALCPPPLAVAPLEVWDGVFEPGSTIASYRTLAVSGVGNGDGYLFVCTTSPNPPFTPQYHSGSSLQCGVPPSSCPHNPNGYAKASTTYGVAVFPDGTAIACGYGGQVMRRDAGSQTWCDFTDRLQFTTGPLWKVAVAQNDQTAWIVGTFNALRRSMDRGLSWQELGSKQAFRPRDLHFLDDAHGWMVGQGTILAETLDGGRNWVNLLAPSSVNGILRGVDFNANGFGVAAGENHNTPDIRYQDPSISTTSWQSATIPPGIIGGLEEVVAVGAGEFWTVGRPGLVLRFLTQTRAVQAFAIPPSVFPDPASLQLRGVVYEPVAGMLYMAGADVSLGSGVMLQLQVSAMSWTRIPVDPSASDLNDLAIGVGPSGPVVYAAGRGGLVLRYRIGIDSTMLIDEDASGPNMQLDTQTLNAVEVASSPSGLQVFAVGDRGSLKWFNGTSWSTPKSNTSLDLLGMHMRSSTIGWVCGRADDTQATENVPRSGIILRYQ